MTPNLHAVTKRVFTEFLNVILSQQLSFYVDYSTVKCQRNIRKTHTGLPLLDYIIQVTNFPAKICTWRKCNLVIMCNIMHFSTVSTSQLKHFQWKVIQCSPMSTECCRQWQQTTTPVLGVVTARAAFTWCQTVHIWHLLCFTEAESDHDQG